jgi:uncharacterized protein (TIGR02117 family)
MASTGSQIPGCCAQLRLKSYFGVYRARTLVVFLIVVAFALNLIGSTGSKEWKYLPATKKDEKTIHVVNLGWHTGIVLSRQDLGSELGFLDMYLRKSPYYEFGWGEADFYQAETITASLTLKALFWRNPTVMHVAAIPTIPDKYFKQEKVVELNLSGTGLEHMRKALRASFKFDDNYHPYPLKRGLYGESKFFKAKGYYSIANTCNTWTASMLKNAGAPMDSLLTLRAGSVINQVEKAKEHFVCRQLANPHPSP